MDREILRNYFKSRMAEMFQYGTFDSYRVRLCNSMEILRELSNVLESWYKGNLKRFDTVALCIDECSTLIGVDPCINFDFYDKKLFLCDLTDYKKQQSARKEVMISETRRIKYLVDECFSRNDDPYLSKLLEAIHEMVSMEGEIAEEDFTPQFDALETLASSLGTELLRAGYSNERLFYLFRSMKRNEGGKDFATAFSEMRDSFTRRSKTTFIIIFKLRFTKQESAQDATANINGIKEALEEDIAKYLKKFSSYRHGSLLTRLYVSQKESLDATSAARLAYNELMHLLDLKQDVVCFVQVPNSAAVMTPSDYGGYTETHENIFLIERRKQTAGDWGTKLQDRVDKINTSPAISQEVKDRISSALRYLRMGDTQLGIEQKFINYWIGLEFIFSSASSSESTYNRMCHHFITIMKSCYIKRHLLFMDQLLREKKCIGAESKRYWEMTTDEQDALYDKTGDALLKYRLKKMKAHLWHGDSKKQFLKRHEERLKQNLERIYRLRNQFIHEAAINESDISHVTSNLRSYLTFILNQLLTFFDQDTASTQPLEMDHFFWQHEHCMRLIENSNWDVGAIMGVQMGEEMIK